MQLIFLGPPGTGQEKQAAILATQWQILHLSIDQIWPQAMAETTLAGNPGCLKTSPSVSDLEMIALLEERLDYPDAQQGWILDGFPQNLIQAQALAKFLADRGQTDPLVIHFETSIEVLVTRLRQQGWQNADEERIRRYLADYNRDIAPLLEFYRQRQCLYPVNGNLPIAAITRILQISLPG